MGKSVVATPGLILFLLLGLADRAAAQDPKYCFGILCNADNSCGSYQGSPSRNCCCQPTCGPSGCQSCVQWCSTACTQACPSCGNCGKAARAAAKETFTVPKAYIDAVWKKHLVAGIVVQKRSEDGTVPLYSHLVGGSTSLYGYPVGFNVNITAESRRLILDIVFDSKRTKGPLPENARFEMDSAGNMTVKALPPDGLKEVDRAVALRDVPCPVWLSLAARTGLL